MRGELRRTFKAHKKLQAEGRPALQHPSLSPLRASRPPGVPPPLPAQMRLVTIHVAAAADAAAEAARKRKDEVALCLPPSLHPSLSYQPLSLFPS